ncbi:MAG: NAD(P)-dependent oxidoreductase [Bacteriovorax sp.]|jgi:nucleoside-diphosphate-sugar epimerase
MKKLIITGASSFIGFHLAKSLSPFYDIVATTTAPLETYSGIQGERLKLLQNQNIKFEILDVRNHDQIIRVIQEHRPAYWINHAGYTKNYASMDYDMALADTIHEAPLGTIYSELAKVGCLGVIGTGTCMEYSDLDNPHSEDETCNPSTPYGKSKLKQTLKSLELGKKHNIPTSIIRVFIPFGDYDDPRKLFPTLIQKLWKNEEMALSAGSQERNFIPIEELIHLYFQLLKNNEGGIYNGASIMNISVKEFILKITSEQKLNQSLLKFGVHPMREGEAPFCTASFEKLRNFYSDKTGNNFFFVESENEFEKVKNSTGFFMSSSPRVKKMLQQHGHFVFGTLPFFSAADHFLLSRKVNSDMVRAERILSEQFNSDFTFNTIFYLQFNKGRDEFKKYLNEKVTNHFPFLTPWLGIKADMAKHPSDSFVLNKLNLGFFSICPQLKDTIFLTADHKLLIEHVLKNHAEKKIGLLICSDRSKSGYKKTLFNFLNLLPFFFKKTIFKHFFNYPYHFVIDASLLVEAQELNKLKSSMQVSLDGALKERVAVHFLASKMLERIFDKYRPNSFFSISNVDLPRYMASYAKEYSINSTLISHGSHAINECLEIEDDLIRHAKGLILGDHSTIISQSPLSGNFLEKYQGSQYTKSAPILWGKKLKKIVSIRNKYAIPEHTKIILHASTPKAMDSRRFVIYETPEEYLNNLRKIAECTSQMDDVILMVKFRPNSDIDLDTIKSTLSPFSHVVIDQETPFLQCLHEVNLLVSYSSTTMEEALHYHVPVIQFSHIYGFNFLPINNTLTAPLLGANEFNIKEKIIEAFESKKDFSPFIYNF